MNRPEVIRDYNHAMGGVDLLDQLTSYYIIFIRSRKWPLRVIMHKVVFLLANSWIEYKRDYEKCDIPKKNVTDLLEFRMRVAECLIYTGKPINKNKRGRPTSFSPRSNRQCTERRPL